MIIACVNALYIGTYAIEFAATAMEMAVTSQPQLAGVALAGFAAQLVDGTLGMGYGLTSSTVLVATGLCPKTASACVHLAQLGTCLVSGTSHHWCGNVEWQTCQRIAVPGIVGALVGTSLMSVLPAGASKTFASSLLLATGTYLFVRFLRLKNAPHEIREGPTRHPVVLTLIGALGGFVDSTGGGGWGPVATSGLLGEGRLAPHRVIGTVSASEFLVTVAAVAGFAMFPASINGAAGANSSALRVDLMLTLLIGGLLAAPLAPHAVARVPPRLLGVVVGGFIVITNARILLKSAAVDDICATRVLIAFALVWAGAFACVAHALFAC